MLRSLLVLPVLCLAAAEGKVDVKAKRETLVLDNGVLRVAYDAKMGTFAAWRGKRAFIEAGRLVETGAEKGKAVLVDVRDALGSGRAVEVTWADGRIRRMALYDGVPFVCIRASVRNPSEKPVTVAEIPALSAQVVSPGPMDRVRGFGPAGLYALGGRTHFCFGAAVDPATRAGVVCGWLTHERGSGVVTVGKSGEGVRFGARAQYGRLLVPAGGTAEGETLAIGCFDDALDGLEAYAAAAAKALKITLPKTVPSGYCTWYHARGSNAKQVAELSDFCGKHLRKFGLEFVQIDDGWQVGGRDFTTYNPRGRYQAGMKPTAERITGNGLRAGIWYIPFGWNPKCKSLAEHGDWFVHRPDGKIYTVRWAGSCLDMTHPKARAFLRKVVSRMSKDWGYKYIKIDGLWTGMAVKILYPSPAYRDDDLGKAVFHDPSKTHVEAYRSGLRLVREAAGDDVFILGCNIAQNARTLGGSFGLVDGMRIGHDIGANWGSVRGCAVPTGRFYFLHGHVWFNDPDCLMLRKPLTPDQARAWGSLLAISGQMNVVSEFLPDLPEDKLDVVRRTMPNHGGLGRPIDLFVNSPATIWHYRSKVAGERHDVVVLMNWDAKKAATRELALAEIGLPAGAKDRYVGFDYWANEFIEPFAGKRTFELRPSSCRVIALRRRLGHPQVVSTSRHVTQGPIDLSAVTWDAASKTLAGRSKVVAGDPYEIRIVAPRGVRATAAKAPAGAKVRFAQSGSHVRVTIDTPTSRQVDWRVSF